MPGQWEDYDFEDGSCQLRVLESPSDWNENEMVLEIEGEINLYNTQAIKESLERLTQIGKRRFYLVFEKVSYIDSSGLGVCLGVHAKLSKQAGFLRIISPSSKVRYVLELTKLQSLMQVFETIEAARAKG